MDTRFWGPSAWQLFHLVAFKSDHPDELLLSMKDILPCKYCRASTTEFIQKNPIREDPGKWLYKIHNMVNDKLRTQCKGDPSVVDPGQDPSFEDVKKRYDEMKATSVPGRDFLFSIATNFPDHPEPSDMCTQRVFLQQLVEVYPFESLRKVFARYMEKNELMLTSRKSYLKWMYGLLHALSKETRTPIPSYQGYAHHVAYYKSGCSKSKYHGKTCRKSGGGLTKSRDHRKTYRITHSRLL